MKINGHVVTSPEPDTRLLDYLRDDLGLTGSKEGCGMGECGSCTVLIDGRPVCSCLVLTGQLAEAEVVTVEGIAEHPLGPALQDALIKNQAVQCGFCTAGIVVSAAALLAEDADPDEDRMHAALEGNICRCTGYGAITRALRSVRR
ncbi:(2Fe-2S)-binding protein [Kribbella solani]|uniref:Carbon-monoxide dehydrogenase small subunit n=1 Tax=Kribbella solani TaxID=236067 RepID=A0A841DP24_9ACTN|nr:(2Fe-2S)-binding protein [Kribbella solani]MBB5980864.1 carbon-monoxide dehydrogenase small subunit [Kribbella solani]MDX2968565.1 (2Fe-2S)-binding protein [Kribbella solani]MDX3003431.1 (2Fe-2S)-binding protein [Kribbella solani]